MNSEPMTICIVSTCLSNSSLALQIASRVTPVQFWTLCYIHKSMQSCLILTYPFKLVSLYVQTKSCQAPRQVYCTVYFPHLLNLSKRTNSVASNLFPRFSVHRHHPLCSLSISSSYCIVCSPKLATLDDAYRV
jgi:hypothetical protein